MLDVPMMLGSVRRRVMVHDRRGQNCEFNSDTPLLSERDRPHPKAREIGRTRACGPACRPRTHLSRSSRTRSTARKTPTTCSGRSERARESQQRPDVGSGDERVGKMTQKLVNEDVDEESEAVRVLAN